MPERERFISHQRSATPGKAVPVKPRAFTAQFSDMTTGGPGSTNPSGIWSPAYQMLKQALDRNDDPDNVLQALYDWLSQRNVKPSEVDRILDLPSPEHAYTALVQLIGGKLSPEKLPPVIQQTLKRAVQRVAQRYVEKGEQALAKEGERLQGLRGRYGVESAAQVVRALLAS